MFMNPFSARVKNGFSLVEVLVVVTIIGFFVVPLLITYQASRSTRALQASAEEVVNNVKSAHIFARESRDRRNWGVTSLSGDKYAIFSKGTGDKTIEKSFFLESGVRFASGFEVLFEIGTGETDSQKTVELENDRGLKSRIEILETGVVEVAR